MTPTPVLPSLPERTPTDYALEFAEYMAKDAEQLIEALNAEDAIRLRREESDDVDDDAVYDAGATRSEFVRGLRDGIFEFRKRRDRAIESLSRAPAEPAVDDSWEANAKYLLDRCPYTVRQLPGGGPEDLMATLVVTFQGMQMRLEGHPLFKPGTESAGPSSPMTLAEATREVGKWLNEEPNRPVDRHALAVMSAACQRLVEPAESAGPAPAEIVLDWLEAEITNLETRMRGSPAYDHDARWMKDKVLGIVSHSRKVFGNVTVGESHE